MASGFGQVVFAHERPMTFELAWAITAAWGEDALRSWARPGLVERLTQSARDVAAGRYPAAAVYLPRALFPGATEPVMHQFWATPPAVADLSSKHAPEIHVKVTYPSLSAARFRYAAVSAPPSGGDDSSSRAGALRLAQTARRVRELLDAGFAFGESRLELSAEGTEDPRTRAWGLTYYGRALVEEIGRERFASAPAHKVDFDDAGGCWVWLVESPFVASEGKERVREAVERHLALRERFGDPR